jgi:hypothetical protein
VIFHLLLCFPNKCKLSTIASIYPRLSYLGLDVMCDYFFLKERALRDRSLNSIKSSSLRLGLGYLSECKSTSSVRKRLS